MSRPLRNGWADRCDLTRPTKELARENGVSTSAVTLARRMRGIPNPTPRTPRRPKRDPSTMPEPKPRKWGTLNTVDLTRPTAELRRMGFSDSAIARARKRHGIAPPAPPRPTRAPKPAPTPSVTSIARQRATSPRESAAVVAPPEPAAANGIDPAIRAALVDEMRGMGTSPGIAAMLIAARFRVAREVVERIAEDVAGMRREVSNG